MRIVRTEQEQDDGYGQEELLRGCILISIVDLFPHIEVVISSSVEFEGYASNVVEHEVRASHVGDVGQGPGNLLGDTRDNIEENL